MRMLLPLLLVLIVAWAGIAIAYARGWRWRRQQRIEDLEAENERLDRIIHNNHNHERKD